MVLPVNTFKKSNILNKISFVVGLIHGDMAQFDRTQVITEFKKRDMPVLIATDVAG
jgi:ATP-dependent RNA helicase DDX42